MRVTLYVDSVPVAQWIARWTSNPKVAGSNPAGDKYVLFLLREFLKFLSFVKYIDDVLYIPSVS